MNNPMGNTVSERGASRDNAQWFTKTICSGVKAACDAYTLLLKVPHSSPYRITVQPTLCELRDFIALATDRTPEDVQTRFENALAKAKTSAVGDRTT